MAKKRILIVEDEADLVKMIETRLNQAGYETLVAYDGMEALDKARKEKLDLIILDLMLPKVDGYNVCAMLKKYIQNESTPIIILTALDQDSDKDLVLDLGANAYITKPFQYKTVLDKIKELLKE